MSLEEAFAPAFPSLSNPDENDQLAAPLPCAPGAGAAPGVPGAAPGVPSAAVPGVPVVGAAGGEGLAAGGGGVAPGA